MKIIKSPVTWFGGKSTRLPKLLPYVPEHRFYLEAFGGGGSVLLAKQQTEFEVYNDVDEGLVCLFRVLRDKEKFERFREKCWLIPYSRQEYLYFKDNWNKVDDEVEKAFRFFYVARASFGGHFGGGWGYVVNSINRSMPQEISAYLSAIERLPEVHARLLSVQVEHLDGVVCLNKYASQWDYTDSFIYLDPPYLPETRRYGKYRYEVDTEYHKKLIQYLIDNQNKNKFMLSGYDSELYRQLEEQGWKKICWEVSCAAVGRTRLTKLKGEGATFKNNQRRVDCIWINY